MMQADIPQVHAAIPLAPVSANGVTGQMPVPVTGAPMVVTGASAPTYQGGADAGGGAGAAPVIPSQMAQMAPMNYPATFDYSAFLDPRGAADPPRRSRRSQRHRSHHRSRRRSRSPTPSTESSGSGSESPYSSPSSYDSADYSRRRRHHRSNSGRNPLPRPPKDILSSTPFRPLLTQLPSAQYNSWGIGGARFDAPPPLQQQQQQQQPPPQQPTTYGNIRPRRQRRGLFNRDAGIRFPVPSLGAAANAIVRPFGAAQTMAMPEPHPAQRPPGGTARGSAGSMPPVIPQMGSPQPPMRMPSPEMAQQGPPVIPQGTPMRMPSPAAPGSTPFFGPAGLNTPVVPPPGQMMPIPVIPSPSSGHVPMPMPSPAVMPGGLTRPTTPSAGGVGVVPPPGSVQVMSAMGMPSPSLGPGAAVGQQIIKFNGYGEFAGLLYHSPHSVVYQDELYPTALHLFEARKFLDHRPDLADRIRQTDHVEQVTAISAEVAEFTRRDWGNVALATVSGRLSFSFSSPLSVSRIFYFWFFGFWFCLIDLLLGCGSRWTRCCISSSASTAICAPFSSALTPPSSCTSNRATPSGETERDKA